MAYRDDVAALSARYDALAGEVAQKTRERDESRHLLDQALMRAKLPVLDNIRVASPCIADWNQMTGDDRTRHCGECKKNVYNLSGMTRDEAEALLIERNGDLCVRYFQRHDGTILLADCGVGAKRRNRRRWIAVGAATLLAGGAGAATVLNRTACESPAVQGEMVMGAVVSVSHEVQGQVITSDVVSELPQKLPTPQSMPQPEGYWTGGATVAPVEPAEARHRPAHPATKMGKLVRSH